MSDKLHIDPLLAADAPPNARLTPCRECANGVGTWWPTHPRCWKCGEVATKFFDERPAPRPPRPRVAGSVAVASPSTDPGPAPLSTSVDLGALDAPPAAPAELVPQAETPALARKRTRYEKHAAIIAAQDRSLRRESAKIVLDSFATFDLPDDGSKPEGWSDRKYRTARLARLPDKDAPAALRHAARILESYRRSEALEDRKPSPQLNCDIQVFVRQEINQTYNYETIEVKDE